MPPVIRNPESRYLADREKILIEIAAVAPDAVRRLRAVDAALATLHATGGRELPYIGIRSTLEAVVACLTREKRWMARYEIAEALQTGGFTMDPLNGRKLVKYNIDKNVQRKKLSKQGELIGLPEWKPDKK